MDDLCSFTVKVALGVGLAYLTGYAVKKAVNQIIAKRIRAEEDGRSNDKAMNTD